MDMAPTCQASFTHDGHMKPSLMEEQTGAPPLLPQQRYQNLSRAVRLASATHLPVGRHAHPTVSRKTVLDGEVTLTEHALRAFRIRVTRILAFSTSMGANETLNLLSKSGYF